jgi:hypothetical protein
MAATIGIKIANGKFYPIIEEKSSVRKRLVLTTVHNRQQGVQIDLYRSLTKTMADAQYIGSLVVENIKPRAKGDPSIELVISSNENGDIVADAFDLDLGADGEHYILNVSLRSLDEDSRDVDIPDFELEQSEHPPSGLYHQAETFQENKKQFPWLIVILSALLVILVAAALWLFLFGGRELFFPTQSEPAVERTVQAEEVPPVLAAPPPPPPPPPAVEVSKPEPPPLIQAPAAPPPSRPQTAQRQRPPAPVASYKVPATIPRGGVPYKIRWGDTLWDISAAFYRNPWLYPRIARFNNIRNPDLIISGTTIRIPPKN